MRPHRRAALLLLALALVPAVAGCGLAAASPTVGPVASASGPIPASPVVGVLVSVDSKSLSDVRGFTLRLTDGRVLDFAIGTLENAAEFPPGHLSEHMATSDPVRVFFRVDGDRLVVYRLEDAGQPAAT